MTFRPLTQTDLTSLRDHLGAELPWSPHAFLPGISLAGDKAWEAERLTRPLEPAQDLRLLDESRPGQPLVAWAERLPWDSDFFGYGVARLDGIFPGAGRPYDFQADYRATLAQVVEQAKSREVKYFLAVVDPQDLPLMRALGHIGFSLIETRAYYHRKVDRLDFSERHAVRLATAADLPSLGQAAREAVNPFDRFHADPFISRAAADRMMYRWMEASLTEGFADFTLVPEVREPDAFSTVVDRRDLAAPLGSRIGQIVLSACGPRGRGWHRKIVAETCYHLQTLGFQHLFIKTQLTNKAVIWNLEKLGFHFGKAELVFRILL